MKLKVIEFGIKSHDEFMEEATEAMNAAMKRLPFKKRKGVYFTSLEAARKFLTPKRVQILHVIKMENPKSIYALAKRLKRSFPRVLSDVELLKRDGLIKLSRVKNAARRTHHPTVTCDAIHLSITI